MTQKIQENTSLPPIQLISINSSTPFPKELSRFWPSIENKKLLEKFLYDFKKNVGSVKTVILGQAARKQVYKSIMLISEGSSDVPELDVLFEEADHESQVILSIRPTKVAQIYVSIQVIQMWQ